MLHFSTFILTVHLKKVNRVFLISLPSRKEQRKIDKCKLYKLEMFINSGP